jgi:hypothetical protein
MLQSTSKIFRESFIGPKLFFLGPRTQGSVLEKNQKIIFQPDPLIRDTVGVLLPHDWPSWAMRHHAPGIYPWTALGHLILYPI